MQIVVDAIPGHDKEIYGVSVESVLTVTLLMIFILIIREISGYVIPRIFGNLRLVSEVARDALNGSGKALGVAGGCWASMYLFEEMDWLASILTLVMVVALVVTAFRFVGIIHAFVLWTDDDGELDGSQKTVVSAAESIMRFLIVIFGMVSSQTH